MEISTFVLTFTVCFSTVIETALGKISSILLFYIFLSSIFLYMDRNMFSNVTFEPNW